MEGSVRYLNGKRQGRPVRVKQAVCGGEVFEYEKLLWVTYTQQSLSLFQSGKSTVNIVPKKLIISPYTFERHKGESFGLLDHSNEIYSHHPPSQNKEPSFAILTFISAQGRVGLRTELPLLRAKKDPRGLLQENTACGERITIKEKGGNFYCPPPTVAALHTYHHPSVQTLAFPVRWRGRRRPSDRLW